MHALSALRARFPRLLRLLPLLLLWSCLGGDPEEVHYVSLEVSDIADSLTAFQRVNIVVTGTGPQDDTLDVLWNDTLPDAGRLKKLKATRYQGGDAIIVIAGYNGEKLRLRRRIAYDGDTKTAVILDKGIRDTLPPVLFSSIPDDTLTLDTWSGFPGSQATCVDDRDGVLKPELDTLPQEVRLPTLYLAIVFCRDLSRNDTRLKGGDTVMVYVKPKGGAKPVLTLNGRDSVDVPLGGSLPHTAECRDEEDGELPIQVGGDMDSSTLGRYVLSYSCRDQDGNSATRKQHVWVSEALDRDPPIATIIGPDSIDHRLGKPYVDMGITCMDLRDGPRPIQFAGGVDVHAPGVQTWEAKCRDIIGNAAYPVRTVRVVDYDSVPVRAECVVDTTAKSRIVNSGMTPVHTFYQGGSTPDDHASLLAFDLDGVDKGSLQSAKGVFQTHISGPYLADLESIPVTFKVYRIRSPWVEGTGNWYYNRGLYQNRGHILLQNHPFREEIKAASTDPIVADGYTKDAKEIIRIPNMQEAGADTLLLTFRLENFAVGNPGAIPPRERMVQVEIDLTRYVLETPDGEDFGLVILAEGMPGSLRINWATKELGDGSLGPHLKLFY